MENLPSICGPDDLYPLLLPTSLDGSLGLNRNRGDYKGIAANTDVEAVRVWLQEYVHSPNTLRSYKKEALRFHIWAIQVMGKPVSSLYREDLSAYEAFLTNPPVQWYGELLPVHGEGHRLLVGPLSAKSIEQAMSILSNMFAYLCGAAYLAGNPFLLRKKKRVDNSRQQKITRYLKEDIWEEVLTRINAMPQATHGEQQRYERIRWVFRFLHGTGLRGFESAKAKTSDLSLTDGKWWLNVVGKGGASGQVPMSDELMGDLARYRQFHGLPALPVWGEITPIVMSIAGRDDVHLTSTAIYMLVKRVFRDIAKKIMLSDPETADKLEKASTHWLRHTAASHQASAGNSVLHIKENLRHASLQTTSKYMHAEDNERHEETANAARRMNARVT